MARRSGGVGHGIGVLGKFIVGLISFVVVSALAGALVAGMVLPAVAGVGLGAKAASDHYLNLPSDFVLPVLPQRNTIEADDGSVIATVWDPDNQSNRVLVPLSQISLLMQHAIVSVEDQRFYQHGGIDFKGTVRALVNNSKGAGNLQGGSTIAQQYIKNALELEAGSNKALYAAAQADTFARKLQELRYATTLLTQMSRDQLLAAYLNLIPFGNDSFGVETAAETYFGTTAAKLTAVQAALLAAIVNSPTADDPFTHAVAAFTRRNTVLDDMAKQGYLTADQAAAAEKQPLGLKPGGTQNGCIAAGSAAFFCTYVRSSFLSDPAYGATAAARKAMWSQGGLVVKTTLDPQDQASGSKAVSDHTDPGDKVATALAMVRPGTGAITAIAQSKPMGSGYGQTYVDLAADPGHGGGEGFQAGSSFKIFEGLAALEDGWNPSTSLSVPSPLVEGGLHVPVCEATSYHPWIVWPSDYTPNNDDNSGFTGTLPEAYWFSVNTYFLTLETHTGLCLPATIAQSMGVTLDNDTGTGAPLEQIASFTLGTNLITPVEMAGAYATLAAHGEYCRPYAITAVTDLSGKQYAAPKPQCAQVVDANLANELTAMLQGVLTVPGATAEGLGIDRPAAGKTGTTSQSIATWFDGFTPQLATAVWTGFVSPKQGDFLGYLSVGGHYWDQQIFGATISAPTWQEAMKGAMKGLPVQDFTAPVGFPPIG